MLGVRKASYVCWYWTTGLGSGEPGFEAFDHFHGVNTPTVTDFKLPIWSHWTQIGGEMSAIGSRGLVPDDSNTSLGFLKSPNHLGWKTEWSFVSQGKNVQVCEKNSSRTSHSLNPKVSSSNAHGTRRESKFWEATCFSLPASLDDSRQERWEVESTFPILKLWVTKRSFPSNNGIQFPRRCLSSDLHLCQCQWRCLNSASGSPLQVS